MTSEQMQKNMMVKKYKKQFKIAKRVIVMNQQLLSFQKKSHRQPTPLLNKPKLDYEEESDSESEEYRKKLVDVLFGDGKRGTKSRGNDQDQDIRRFLEEQIPGLYEEEDCCQEESEEEEQKINYGFNDSIAPQYLTMSRYQKMDYFDNLNAVYMAKMRVTKKDLKRAQTKAERVEKVQTKIGNEQKKIEDKQNKVGSISEDTLENKQSREIQQEKQQRKEQQVQAIKQERKQQVQTQSLEPQNISNTIAQVSHNAGAQAQCEKPADTYPKKITDGCFPNNIKSTPNSNPIQKPRHIRFNEIVCEVIFNKQSEPITIKQSPEQSSFIMFDDDAYEESSESSQEQIQEEDPRQFAGRLMGVRQKYQIGHMVRKKTTAFPQKDENDRIFFDPEDVSQDSEQQDDLDNILIEEQDEDEHFYEEDQDEQHFFNYKSNEFTKQRLQFYRQMEELDKRNQSSSQDEDQQDQSEQAQPSQDSQEISSSSESSQSQRIQNNKLTQQKQNSNIIQNTQLKNNSILTSKHTNLTIQPQHSSSNHQNPEQRPSACFKRDIHGKFISRQSQQLEPQLSTLPSKQTNEGQQISTQLKQLDHAKQLQELSSFMNGRKIIPHSFDQPFPSSVNQANQEDNPQDNGLKQTKDQSTSAQLIVLQSHILVESTKIPLP